MKLVQTCRGQNRGEYGIQQQDLFLVKYVHHTQWPPVPLLVPPPRPRRDCIQQKERKCNWSEWNLHVVVITT